ncbi:MAG TPA: hypothetical protein VGI83_01295 [Gemmatimonadales bacterium]
MKPWWIALSLVVLAAALNVPMAGGSLWSRFFHSLRIDKPQAVTVSVPGFSGPNASRLLTDMIAGMIADTAAVVRPEADRPATDLAAASREGGFPVGLPAGRKDKAELTVVGGHEVTMRVNRPQLVTILREAGQQDVVLPDGVHGAPVTVRTPRGVRAQYGHCPLPVPATIQGQIQGPPPTSTDNGDCVVLTERPATAVDAPAGLDPALLVGIGLELSGMSPNQAQAFQRTFDWRSTLSVSLPRFLRSYDSVTVGDARGVLFSMASRRGPSYQLIWSTHGVVYSLVGYGSSADALPLANSIK